MFPTKKPLKTIWGKYFEKMLPRKTEEKNELELLLKKFKERESKHITTVFMKEL